MPKILYKSEETFRNIDIKNILRFIFICLFINQIFVFTDLDIYIQRFYFNGEWFLGETAFAVGMYQFLPIVSITVAILGLFMYIYYKLKKKNLVRQKIGLFLILSMLLGPGLLVNSIGKGFVGRPRPKHLLEFGGEEKYLPPLVLGKFIPDLLEEDNWAKKYLGIKFVQGRFNSFPSGHGSVAFYLIFPYFIMRKMKLKYLMPGFILGWLMGIVRMVQGGHFLSDVYWAFLAVFTVNYILSKAMKLEEVLNHVKER